MMETILAVWLLVILVFCTTITLKLDNIKCKLDEVELRLKCNEKNIITIAEHLANLQLLITRY